MKRIVIGGQIDKQKVADITAKIAGDRASIEIKSDIEAAMAIKTGSADYYFATQNTRFGNRGCKEDTA